MDKGLLHISIGGIYHDISIVCGCLWLMGYKHIIIIVLSSLLIIVITQYGNSYIMFYTNYRFSYCLLFQTFLFSIIYGIIRPVD